LRTMTETSNTAPAEGEISINIKGIFRSTGVVHSEYLSYGDIGPSELKLTINISLDKTVRDLKQAISERSDVEADRQRLIYSGA
jgi:hypothetical protein